MPVARQALAGVNYCKNQADCWRSANTPGNGTCQTEPDVWALFVAWAVAFDSYSSVNLMNYPPISNMLNASSTDNVTMHRWNHVLETVGVPPDELGNYEVIVNTRPIVAPGFGNSTVLPQSVDATVVFGSEGRDWIGEGLGFFTEPPSNQAENALPILVLGGPARKTWAEFIEYTGEPVDATCRWSDANEVPVLAYGKTKLPGATKEGWWLASNHPDETMYNCCPGDPTSNCQNSTNLVACDKIDLTAVCMQYAFGQNPDADGDVVFNQCNNTWNSENPSPDVALKICINARMSYNFNSEGLCKCKASAEAFCAANNSNACNQSTPGQALMCTEYNAQFCDQS